MLVKHFTDQALSMALNLRCDPWMTTSDSAPTHPAVQLPKWGLFLLTFPTSLNAENRLNIILFPLPRHLSLLQKLPCPLVSLVKMVVSCSVFASPLPAFSSDDHHIKELILVSWPFSIHLITYSYSYSCMAQPVMSESIQTL